MPKCTSWDLFPYLYLNSPIGETRALLGRGFQSPSLQGWVLVSNMQSYGWWDSLDGGKSRETDSRSSRLSPETIQFPRWIQAVPLVSGMRPSLELEVPHQGRVLWPSPYLQGSGLVLFQSWTWETVLHHSTESRPWTHTQFMHTSNLRPWSIWQSPFPSHCEASFRLMLERLERCLMDWCPGLAVGCPVRLSIHQSQISVSQSLACHPSVPLSVSPLRLSSGWWW